MDDITNYEAYDYVIFKHYFCVFPSYSFTSTDYVSNKSAVTGAF